MDSNLVVPLEFSLREGSPGVQPPLMRTSLPPGYHENHLIWVNLSLMVLWDILRLLDSDHKDQPPLPDHLKNLLIWVYSIKVIPLGFAQYAPWEPSRSSTKPGYSHLSFIWLKWRFSWLNVFILLSVLYILYCAFILHSGIHSISFGDCQLSSLMCIILVLVMHSRYFHPVTRNCNTILASP